MAMSASPPGCSTSGDLVLRHIVGCWLGLYDIISRSVMDRFNTNIARS